MGVATRTVDLDEALVRRFVKANWNDGVDTIGDVVAPSYVDYSPDRLEGIHGLDDLEEYLSALQVAFTNVELPLDIVATAGDTVSTSWRVTGTNETAFMGRDPVSETPTLIRKTLRRNGDGYVQESKSVSSTADSQPQHTDRRKPHLWQPNITITTATK